MVRMPLVTSHLTQIPGHQSEGSNIFPTSHPSIMLVCGHVTNLQLGCHRGISEGKQNLNPIMEPSETFPKLG